MTPPEFDQWLDQHKRMFCPLGPWIARGGRSGDQHAADPEAALEILRGWATILRDVALEPAKAASLAMSRDASLVPQGWSGHPGVVRALALRAGGRARTSDQQAEFRREREEADADKRRIKALEERHGATLDAMSQDEVQAMVETLPAGYQYWYRANRGSVLVREALLEALAVRLDAAEAVK